MHPVGVPTSAAGAGSAVPAVSRNKYVVVGLGGATVRMGAKLDSPVLKTLPQGTVSPSQCLQALPLYHAVGCCCMHVHPHFHPLPYLCMYVPGMSIVACRSWFTSGSPGALFLPRLVLTHSYKQVCFDFPVWKMLRSFSIFRAYARHAQGLPAVTYIAVTQLECFFFYSIAVTK